MKIMETKTAEKKPSNFASQEDLQLFTVSRGERLNDKLIEQRIREFVYNENHLNALLQKIKSSKGNYSGTFYSNYFRVDHPIRLIDVGFFGPCDVEYGSYFVHIEIFGPSTKSNSEVYPSVSSGKVLAKTRRFITVKKESNFFVELSNGGVEIKPGVWHLIQFMLEGPSTHRCESTIQSARVKTDDKEVTFEFNSGSMQMPYLRFTI